MYPSSSTAPPIPSPVQEKAVAHFSNFDKSLKPVPMHHLSSFSLIVEDHFHKYIECALVTIDYVEPQLEPLGKRVGRVHDRLKDVVYKAMVCGYPFFGCVPSRHDNTFVPVHVDMDEHLRHVCVGESYEDTDSMVKAAGGVKDLLYSQFHSEQIKKYHETEEEEEALQRTVSSWLNVPFRDNLPYWEILIIHNYSKGLLLLFRIHHCLGDGTTLASVFRDICHQETMPKNHIESVSVQEKLTTSLTDWRSICMHAFDTVRSRIRDSLNIVLSLFTLLLLSMITVGYWLWDWGKGKDLRSTVNSRQCSELKNAVWIEGIMLRDAIIVSKALGATINDVFLSCFAGALSAFLKQDTIHNRQCKTLATGDLVHYRFSIPVNIRETPWEVDPWTPNMIGFMVSSIPVHKISSGDRLKLVKRITQWTKHLPQALLTYYLTWLSLLLPDRFVKSLFATCASFSTVAFTNVRGGNDQLYLLGHAVKSIVGFNPSTTNIPLSCLLMSYYDKITFSIVSDTLTTQEASFLREAFCTEFKNLYSLASKT